MKDAMIVYLKEMNKKAMQQENIDLDKITTVLYFNNGTERVTDYSPFADYMSEGLRNALVNGQTLTDDQQMELNLYTIENEIH